MSKLIQFERFFCTDNDAFNETAFEIYEYSKQTFESDFNTEYYFEFALDWIKRFESETNVISCFEEYKRLINSFDNLEDKELALNLHIQREGSLGFLIGYFTKKPKGIILNLLNNYSSEKNKMPAFMFDNVATVYGCPNYFEASKRAGAINELLIPLKEKQLLFEQAIKVQLANSFSNGWAESDAKQEDWYRIWNGEIEKIKALERPMPAKVKKTKTPTKNQIKNIQSLIKFLKGGQNITNAIQLTSKKTGYLKERQLKNICQQVREGKLIHGELLAILIPDINICN